MNLRHNITDGNVILQIFLPERIDNTNIDEFREALNNLISENTFQRIILEASNLSQISNVGIRYLVKLKRSGIDFEIVRVDPKLAETLFRFNLDSIIPIFTEDSTVYTKNLPVLFENIHYITYQLDKDKALKVYKDISKRELAMKEKHSLQEGFLLCIPTLLPYNYVKTMKGNYGLIYELPKASNYETLILKNPEKEDEYLNEFINATKEIHNIKVPNYTSKADIKEKEIEYLYDLGIIDENELKHLYNFYSYIPDEMNFLHEDLAFRNFIKTDEGENLFININDIAYGHPILDIYRLYLYHYLLPKVNLEGYKKFSNLPVEVGQRLTDKFVRDYFKDEENRLDDIYRDMHILSIIDYLIYLSDKKDDVSKEQINNLKKELFTLLKSNKFITF